MTASRRARRACTFVAAALWSLAVDAVVAGPSTQVVVDGAVTARKTYDLAGLETFTPSTRTETYRSGANTVTDTFTGAALSDVLNSAGIVTSAVKNDILDKVVVATGSDGYKAVYALGELNPGFGNRHDLVAYADTLGQLPGSAGFARVTASGDVQGGRYVSNLSGLTVVAGAAPRLPSPVGGPSTSFTVSGDVGGGRTFDLAALALLPSTTEVVNGVTYTGATFWNVLQAAGGVATDPTIKNDLLRDYVVATGSDGYQVAFSIGELDPLFGDAGDLIAYAASDGSVDTTTGFARVIVPGDGRAGRFVSNLVSLQVFDATAAVPEPPALALFAAGLSMAMLQRRRRTRLSRFVPSGSSVPIAS